MNVLTKSTITITLAVFLAFLMSCGGKTEYCTPNFVQGNIGLRVTYLVNSLNEFQFHVCYNDDFDGSQFSVYGVETEADIATISSADVRQGHITDGFSAGSTFSVTFNSNDAWFVIYEDDNLGNFANVTEIIRGEFR